MTDHTTGMAYSILAEISQLLTTLSERGETGAIDLRSLPMTDADRGQLEEILGRGEVRAELDLAGASEVEEIAVTPMPEILMTHPADIAAASRRIRQDLDSAGAQSHEQKHELGQKNEWEARNV